MIIRKLSARDLPTIVTLAEQLGYRSTLSELTARFADLNEDPAVALFVGEAESRVMAFMQIREESTLMTGKRAELDAVVVDQAFRGKGAGKEMLAVAESWAKSRGAAKLRLGSRTSRTDAHEFYKRIGFAIEKTWYVFSKALR